MTRRKATERWETRIANCEATPQALWPIAKSFLKRDGPKAPTAIHGSSGLKFHRLEKVNAIANYLENLFTTHDLCDEIHERRVKAGVQALLETVDNSHPDSQTMRRTENNKDTKDEEAVELMAFQTSASGVFQEDHWYTSLIYLTIAFGYHTFLRLGRKTTLQPYQNLVRNLNFLKICIR
jgi:hypothetical protein